MGLYSYKHTIPQEMRYAHFIVEPSLKGGEICWPLEFDNIFPYDVLRRQVWGTLL